MKIISYAILTILLLGCQAEPELENSCDCEGETVKVANKFIGTVYFDQLSNYGIDLIYSGGKIGVKPCDDIDSIYLYEGSQVVVSGNIKVTCFPFSQPTAYSHPYGYNPIEITFIEPYIENQ